MIRPINNSDTASTSFQSEDLSLQQGRSGQYGYSETQSSIDFGDCTEQTSNMIQDYIFSPIYNYVLTPIYNFFRYIGQLMGCPCACSAPEEEHFGDEESSIGDIDGDSLRSDEARETGSDGALRIDSLEITEEHKEHIRWIYQHLAEDNVISLGFIAREIERHGNGLNTLHPFRNMAFVFGDDALFGQFQAIRARTPAVSGRFITGYNAALTDSNRRHELLPYVDSLAETMRADPATVRGLVVSRNWNEMINHFIGIRTGRIPAYQPPTRDETGANAEEEARRLEETRRLEEARRLAQAGRTDEVRVPTLSQRQIASLRTIFRTVANTNNAALVFQINNLRNTMLALSTVSPKLILHFISTDPEIIGDFHTISLDTLKRRHFMSDFQDLVLAPSIANSHADVNDDAFWTGLGLQVPSTWEVGLQNIIRSKILTKEQIMTQVSNIIARHNVMALGTTHLAQILMLWGDLGNEKPLEVLRHAFTDDTCKDHLAAIKGNTLKKGPFITSFVNALTNGARNHPVQAGELTAFCREFAISGLDAGPENVNWRELVKVLFREQIA